MAGNRIAKPRSERDVPPPQTQHVALRQEQIELWAGPIPAPEQFTQYAAVDPTFPNRILTMAEEQARHRQSIELQVTKGRMTMQSRGQALAFIVTMATLVGGFWLIHSGKDAVGITSVITAAGGLAAVFAINKWQEHMERKQRFQAVAGKQ